ncbi:MAG: oxidoreductase [Gammaproteobacteria bacterium]|nr:oxidoreductase [Gammaproteobacteria bacterium]
MALIWKKQTKNAVYELRSAGSSLRLYTNNVFHTQYSPKNSLTGHVWDLLMLPAFFYQPGEIKRVLVLGVGGGAVLQLLKEFSGPDKITGIELNPVHLYVARKFFNLKGKDIQLYQADAVSWLKSYKGEKFDMIIDDLFYEEDGEPLPVTKANGIWFTDMLKHLSREGVIVRNFLSKDELMQSAGLRHKSVSHRFKSVFQLGSCLDENFVGVFLRRKVTARLLRKRLMETPGLNPALKTSRLRYRIRCLK